MISRYVEPNDSIFWLYNLFFMGNNITNRLLKYLVYFGLKIDFVDFLKKPRKLGFLVSFLSAKQKDNYFFDKKFLISLRTSKLLGLQTAVAGMISFNCFPKSSP